MTPVPATAMIGLRTTPEVAAHFTKRAEREGMRLSAYLSRRLRELRAADLLLERLDREDRNLVRIIQGHVLRKQRT